METETIEILPSTRFCFVPYCFNNSKKQRNMVFVPVKKELKRDWCIMLDRTVSSRQLYCCEIHLDLEHDLENYHKWKTTRCYPIMSKNATLKRIPPKPSTSTATTDFDVTMVSQTVESCDKIVQVKPVTHDKSLNVTEISLGRRFKKTKVELIEESITPAQSGSSYECEQTGTSSENQILFSGRNHLLSLIHKNPLRYLGVPKSYYWIIDFIVKKSKKRTNSLNIIVTLFKIRQGDTLVRISDQFQINMTRLHKIFYETTILLSSYFQNFIYLPSLFDIKNSLPSSFKINYSNVIMIIDCFEIGIEKPTNPIQQSQTWSAYKSCNTVKYLVGSTPSGLINFISKGYGGRISDKAITIESGLIEYLPINSVIMADRGFKEIESCLAVKNIKLLRLPSVYSNIKPTAEQVRESKVIASLRIHIERVIRRLREFRILKPHSVINHKHVPYLDEYVMIACGLCNLQGALIKGE